MKSQHLLTATIILAITCLLNACRSHQYDNWEYYKGSPEGIHYSTLTQVDTSNVSQLQVAWEYHTGDADTVNHSQIQCNPIIVNGVLYGTTPTLKLFAIDAATGKEQWVFDPNTITGSDNKSLHFILNNNRGVSYWTDKKNDRRIYYTAGSKLFAVNADSGTLVTSFGHNGAIDLHEGLDRPGIEDLFITATSPPLIFNDILVTGTRVDEGAQAAPGHIRGYDVRSGKQLWIFHTIPHPGEPGFETWEDSTAYKHIGGANAWSGFTIDQSTGLLYAGTGSASYDFYGGKRLGNNLYANCVLALDINTGRRKWHFQVIHHDVWDRDLSSPPILVHLNKDGQKIAAVAVTTKSGYIYVFDRLTGKPIYEVKEQPVPTVTDLVGEKLSPTQPYPTWPAPFMRQRFTEADINPYLPDSSIADIRQRLRTLSNDHIYNPITLTGTVEFPGLDGGAEWGGPSFDPQTGILYVNANEMPWEMVAVDISRQPEKEETYAEAGKRLYRANCMTCHGPDRQGSGNFPSLVNAYAKYTMKQADTLLQTGRRMMPGFRHLMYIERKAIAAYVLNNQSLQIQAYKDSSGKAPNPYKVPYAIQGYNRFLSKEGYPAIAPPWGTLNAIDLNTGKQLWQTTLGHDSTVNSPKPTGTENYGGGVVTAGGLIFIGATKDGKFRAFHKRTGKLLWEVALPAAAFATPAVYQHRGRQYIVIACGGGKSGLKSGDSYIAFALPEKK